MQSCGWSSSHDTIQIVVWCCGGVGSKYCAEGCGVCVIVIVVVVAAGFGIGGSWKGFARAGGFAVQIHGWFAMSEFCDDSLLVIHFDRRVAEGLFVSEL